MKLLHLLSAAAVLLAGAAYADIIVTKDGSTLNGKILGIDSGTITVQTDFAGEIEIEQAQVASITTDEPVYLTLDNGSTYLGPVESEGDTLVVESDSGAMTASLESVRETWYPGQKSPSELRQEQTISELQRKWAYQAAFDMTGKTGNSESTGIGTSFRATLKGPQDQLEFFASANFEDADGVKSADDARGGVDYSNRFGGHYNWYVRAEFGYDAIKDIDNFFTVAGGFGYIFSDTDRRALSIRGGVGYLFESYSDVLVGVDPNGDPIFELRPDDSAASLDLGLTHRETFKWGTLNNRLTITPTIEDFSNFRLVHDTNLEVPLKAEGWSIRTGIRNRYDSEADLSNKEELDTTYYVRMVLRWL